MSHTDARFVAAILRNDLGAEATRVLEASNSPGERRRAESAIACCRQIAEHLAHERQLLVAALAESGIAVTPLIGTALPQRHEIRFETTRVEAQRAALALERDGYRRHPVWTDGAERSFWATSDEVTLTRSNSWTTVVRLQWSHRRPTSQLMRLFRPRPADWDAVRLPGPLWWAYRLVRPVRLVVERSRRRTQDHAALEPFLATPISLIEPLLELAAVGPSDVGADSGCGDGRIVLAAARTRGCRAVGIEYSVPLASGARTAVEEEGLTERVRILQGDGRDLEVSDVTVVLLFLPMTVAARLVPDLLARLHDGARLVLHEQSPLPAELVAPTLTQPIVSADAVTVAHLWIVGNSALGAAAHAPDP